MMLCSIDLLRKVQFRMAISEENRNINPVNTYLFF